MEKIFVNVVVMSREDPQVTAELSTIDEVKANKVTNNEYSIIYIQEEFLKLNPENLGKTIVDILLSNYPGHDIVISLMYIWDDSFDLNCGIQVMEFHEALGVIENNIPSIEYNVTETIDYLSDNYDDELRVFDFDSNDDSEDDEDEDDDSVEDHLFGPTGFYDDGGDDYPRRSKSRKAAEECLRKSEIFRNSDHAKRDVRRHNILIASDKESRRRDRKTIMKFLKVFLPGKDRWIREYREEVCIRWLYGLSITKKEAKQMKKAHKYQYRDRPNKERNRSILNFTKRLLAPYDPFNDPNK